MRDLIDTDKLRAARSLPAPHDWPDGDEGGVWREDLQCGLREVIATLAEHRVDLMLCEGSVTDGRGAIQLALDIDPKVRLIVTYSGKKPDTAYQLDHDGEWQCKCLRRLGAPHD